MSDQSETIKIIIDVIGDTKGALESTAKALKDINEAGKESASWISSNQSALSSLEGVYASLKKGISSAKTEMNKIGVVASQSAAKIKGAQTSIKGTSQELEGISKSGNSAATGLAASSVAIGNAINKYSEFKNIVAQAREELNKTGTVSKETAEKIKNAGNEAKKSSTYLEQMGTKLKALFTIAAASYAIKKLVDLADTYTSLDARIKLVTSSTAEAVEIHEKLYEVAQRTRSAFESTADVYSRFAQAVKGKGMGQEELLQLTETLQKALVISGAKPQEAAATLVQLSQSFSSGVMRGDEFNSVMEQGGRIIQMFTDYLKVDRGELRSMAEQGKLTGDVLRNAIMTGAAKVNEEFDRMPETVGQASVKLENAFESIVSGANDSSGETRKIADAIDKVTATVETNKPTIISLFTDIIQGANWAAQRVLNVANSIRGMAAVASGALNFKDFMGMSPEDFKEWDNNFGTYAGDLKIKIKKTQDELSKLGESGPEAVQKAQEMRKLQDELSAYEAAAKKAAGQNKKLGDSNLPLVQKTKLVSNELSKLTEKYLPIEAAQKKYKEALTQIDMAEKAGQFSGDKKKNEELAALARTNAAKQLKKIEDAQNKVKKGAKGASTEWSKFGNAVKESEAQMKSLSQELEMKGLQKTIDYQNKILGKAGEIKGAEKAKIDIIDQQIAKYKQLAGSIPKSTKGRSSDTESAQLEQKINGLLVERQKIIVAANNAKIQGLAEEKILSLEMERVNTETYHNDYQKAQEQLRIDKEIAEERLKLKQSQLASMQVDGSGSTTSDIIKAKNEILQLQIELQKIGTEGRKNLAKLKLDEISDSWRQNTESVAEYRKAVQEAYDSGAIKQKEYETLMVQSGDSMWEAFAAGAKKSFNSIKTDEEVMYEVGQNFADQLSSGFSTAFQSIADGSKTAGEAFADMARNMISWLAQIIMKQMVVQALQSMGLFSEGGQVGSTQKLADGGSVSGFSPDDKADNIPIWATAGEFMHPVAAVKHYGLAFMEAVRTLRFPRTDALSLLRNVSLTPSISSFKLASGGSVPSLSTSGFGPSSMIKGSDVKLKVVNAINSANVVGEYLKSADGETVLLNMIKRNGTMVRSLIGG